MATINMVLDKRRKKKDGSYPIVFRIRIKEKYRDIGTGFSVLEKEFSSRSNSVKNNSFLNEQLEKLRASYYQKIVEYTVENKHDENIDKLKDYLTNKKVDELTIDEVWKKEIASMKQMNRLGNASVHKTAYSVISQEIDIRIPFSKFGFKELVQLEKQLYQRGMTVNGVSVYLRSFRAICNIAIKNDYVPYSWYPFRKLTIKSQKTTPRVLTMKELKDYFALDLKKTDVLYKSWCIGKLIFMLRGINIIDLMLLTTKNIKRDRLIYKRSKTKKMYSIKITPAIQDVLSVFEPNETLLGILSSSTYLNQDRTIENQTQRKKVLNAHLKKLGQKIGSSEPITTYVFRYTYANIAKQLGYSKDLIAEALGHEYGNKVTGIYLELFDLEKLDEMNDAIVKTVLA
jgi:integrase